MSTAKRVCLCVAIALSMAAASAEAANWVPMGENTNGDTFYVDQASVRRNGDALEIWSMVNLASVSRDGARSRKTAFLLKCDTWEVAVWSATDYSEPDGGGQIVGDITARPHEIAFQPAIPDTAMDRLLKFACGRSG